MGSAAAVAGLPQSAFAAEALRYWAPGIARVGNEDWSDMEGQAGITIANSAKSARADESIQKMVVGDGNQLYDAMTDNGGGMEDALASQDAIAEIDAAQIPNWSNLLPRYAEGGDAYDTIRHEGRLFAVPYISNADSLAFNYE
jgi:spermidine/putrescine-binding protein